MEESIDLGISAAALGKLALEKVSTGKGLSSLALADYFGVSLGAMAPIRPLVTNQGYAEEIWTPRGRELVATEKGVVAAKRIFNLFGTVIHEEHTHITNISQEYLANIVRISDSSLENFLNELTKNINESNLSEQKKSDIQSKITQLVSALSGIGMLGISLKTLFGDP